MHHLGQMGAYTKRILAALIVLSVGGCANRARDTSFEVFVQAQAASCTIKVQGREVTMGELPILARREAMSRRHARVASDMADVPYRCVGGVIFTLQQAGFKDVGFVAAPPTSMK